MTLRTDQTGLSDTDVARLQAEHGRNVLPQGKQVTPLEVLARQFKSVLILLLVLAGAVALFQGERIDAFVIALVVVLNAVLGFVQEWRAETALGALQAMLTPHAVVLRNGREVVIDARDLVPGDLVILQAGDRVPADITLHSVQALQVDESVLTGESVPVHKTEDPEAAALFMGTTVVHGRGEGVVTAIGAKTAFGHIADLTGSVGPKITSLQRKLGVLAQQLGLAAVLIGALVVGVGMAAGRSLSDMFMTGVSLAVAMVPEGLPAVVTITLALGAAAMARKNALARRLQAVETLGAASVICTDKTGTLTENKMTVAAIWTPAGEYTVTGTGYDPAGHIERDGQRVRAADDARLAALLRAGVVCNHATLRRVGEDWHMVGAPTEGALITLAAKGWSEAAEHRHLIAEAPFSSDRKRMAVLADHGDGPVVYMKGAPEAVLAACTQADGPDGPRPLTDADRAAILAAYEGLAAQGYRVIALAMRAVAEPVLHEGELTFLGHVGLIDPLRPEVRDAVAAARGAGIRVVVITGDSSATATAIARDLGLAPDLVLNGADVDAADDAALSRAVAGNVLFARTRPDHKMRIVQALQAQDQIVAMTGDGVNDAPALKQADIGVAMGVRGTDVAKGAADLVLLDDNFATIVAAISEGRRQFDNVRKFVRYLLSSNAGEVVAILLSILMGGPLIFLATQILWMNLVTDGVTAVALGMEKSETGQMRDPPRQKNQRILGGRGLVVIGLFGLYTGLASLWLFQHLLPLGVDLARTAAFTAIVVFEKLSVFAFRSLRAPCWHIGWLSNPFLLLALTLTIGAQVAAVYWPPLQLLLHTVPIGMEHWQIIAALAAPLVIVPELVKSVRMLRAGRT
ncbi:cation-translocating P-type ATPase [Actibacterium ureilyticum]|uniref:cation-translocating P-type ATPase n=1 Tax=Actibacterium ureilyticum TaxID=1590614 RepID=UPI001FE621BC|nr:HAD-IC family P-type ATPase [Actibacterium ureilyticum]